jgi:flagellar protein FlaG
MDLSSINPSAAHVAAPVAPSPTPADTASHRTLIQAVKAVDAAELFGEENELTFVLDRTTKRPVARIVNRKTGELIRQIPPETVLRLAQELTRG